MALFEKGKSGNPVGRPKGSLNICTHEDKETVSNTIKRTLLGNKEEIDLASKDPKISMLEKAIIGITKDAVDRRDEKKLEMLLSRWIGKHKEDMELTRSEIKIILPDDRAASL